MCAVRSALYTGTVHHDRKVPRRNAFHYGIYFLLADLDELEALDARHRLFGHNRGWFVSLHDADHGPHDGSPLKPWITELCALAGVDLTGGSVQLLTFPRVLGFKFYPVSFWYCFSADSELRAILAEVQNTFGDRHNYLLHNRGDVLDWSKRSSAIKVFHVSPFIEMDARYEFHFTRPGDTLSVSIYDYVKSELLLVAGVALRRREIDDGTLLRTVLRYGPMSLRAWLLIHLQAIRIFSKRIRYVPRTPPPDEETSL